MTKGTKSAIKADYIKELVATYPTIYVDGSRPLNLANEAADNALAGKIRLGGDCWFNVLKAHGVQKGSSRAMIAALPE